MAGRYSKTQNYLNVSTESLGILATAGSVLFLCQKMRRKIYPDYQQDCWKNQTF